MTCFCSCPPGKMTVDFLRRTKGELSRSTKVCTFVVLALVGQGGTTMIEALLWRDPIALRLKETDSRLDEVEAVDKVRGSSDTEPTDRVGVMVAEFRIVSEPEEPEKSRERRAIDKSPEKPTIES